MLLGLFLLLFLVTVLCLKFSIDFQLVAKNLAAEFTVSLGVGSCLIRLSPWIMGKIERMIRSRPVQNMAQLLRRLGTVLRALDHIAQEIELLQLHIRFGLGDPFWTAFGCGSFWSVLGSAVTGLSAKDRLQRKPEIVIQPNFEQAGLHVYLRCIFRFRLGQIIVNEIKRQVSVGQI